MMESQINDQVIKARQGIRDLGAAGSLSIPYMQQADGIINQWREQAAEGGEVPPDLLERIQALQAAADSLSSLVAEVSASVGEFEANPPSSGGATELDEVGIFAMKRPANPPSSNSQYQPGGTAAGSSLDWSDAYGSSIGTPISTGTWQAYYGDDARNPGIWKKIA